MQALWLGISRLSTFALAIVSTALLSRYLNKTEYGTYRQIIYVYSTLLVIFSAGIPSVFSYFLPRYSLQQGKEIAKRLSIALFMLGFLFSIALFALSGLIAKVLVNPELEKGLKLFSVIPMLLLPTLGLDGMFSSYKKTQYIPVYYTITRVVMLLFIVLPVVVFDGSYEYAIYGWILSSILSFFLAMYFQRMLFEGIDIEKSFLSHIEIFKYSLPIATASLWSIAIKSADQFYISRFFGIETFAEFSNGFIELPFVSMITYATANVVLPIFSKMSKDKSSIEEVMNLWRSTIKKSALILYPLVIFFIINARALIIFLYSDTYETSIGYFQIAMVLNFFNIILFSPLMFSIGQTKAFSRIHLYFALAVWGLDYLVIVLFDSPIAIAVCSVSLGILKVLVFIKFLTNYFKIGLSDFIPIKDIAALIIHSFLVIALTKLLFFLVLPNVEGIMNLLLSFVLFSSLLIATSRAFNIDYHQVAVPILNKTGLFKNRFKKSS